MTVMGPGTVNQNDGVETNNATTAAGFAGLPSPASAPVPEAATVTEVSTTTPVSEAASAPVKRKHAKGLIALGIIAVIMISIGGVLVILLMGGKIAWKAAYGDIDLDYVTQTTVRLAVEADDGVLDKISYEGECEYKNNVAQPEKEGKEVKWDLSNGSGKCVLKAKYQLKTIEKVFTVVSGEVEREALGLEDIYRSKIDPNADDDGDGLINKREQSLKTKTDLTDTDGDGLTDGYEVDTLKTDPLKSDTDGDGLNDASEVKLGFDPLKEDSKGDGVKDGERKTGYSYKDNGVTIKISGVGDIANVTIDVTNGAALSKKAGLIPRLFSFYAAGKVEDVSVAISYTSTELANAKVAAKDLTLYRYDIEKDSYEIVDTAIDQAASTVAAKIDNLSSYYVIGSKNATFNKSDPEIMFVLDNSFSMYTNEQYKRIMGKDYPSRLGGNDPDGRRFTLTGELAERLSKKGAKIGIAEFSGDYVTVKKIGSDIEDIKSTLEGMNEHFYTKVDATNITGAIQNGAKEFSSGASGLKTVVVLTDGKDNMGLAQRVNGIINEMTSQNVRVCMLGFGAAAYYGELSTIANGTGCRFFSSTDVTGLDEVFMNLEILLNDELADVDGDGKMDGYVMADSGFVAARDGFSFRNYSSNLMTDGHCYGMATFAQLYYAKKMPLRRGVIKAAGMSSYSYNLEATFKDYQNLYDYKLQTNALKYMPQFGYDYFNEKEPVDKWSGKDGVISYSSRVRAEINDTGLYEFYDDGALMDAEAQITKYGFSYRTIEKARLSETKMQDSATMNDVDRSLLNAIFASQIRQTSVKMYSSGSAIGINATKVDAGGTKRMTNSNDFMALLTSRIRGHEAPVILAYFSGGLHAMNAINLVQDAKDSNHYYIGVYDSNYPGEKRYLELQCGKYSCTTVANGFYDQSGEVIRMSVSQAEDLKHFE